MRTDNRDIIIEAADYWRPVHTPKVCDHSGVDPRAVVVYDGPACPLCAAEVRLDAGCEDCTQYEGDYAKLEDECDELRRRAEDLEDEVERLTLLLEEAGDG